MIKFETKLVKVRLNDEGQLHGGSFPAVEWIDGTKEWWWHGKRSHTRKAAIIYPNGSKENWFHGIRHCWFVPSVLGCYVSDLRDEEVVVTTGTKKTGYKKLKIKYPVNPLNRREEKFLFHIFGKEMTGKEWVDNTNRLNHLKKVANYRGYRYNPYSARYNRWANFG